MAVIYLTTVSIAAIIIAIFIYYYIGKLFLYLVVDMDNFEDFCDDITSIPNYIEIIFIIFWPLTIPIMCLYRVINAFREYKN
jgi:hypothetical protein